MGSNGIAFGKQIREQFPFDPEYTPINHGAYGTVPKAVLQAQRKFQADLDAQPDTYIRYNFPRLLNESRAAVAKFVNADVDEIVLVPNATTAYNTVLRCMDWKDGDFILYYDIVYGSLHKTIIYLEETTPLRSKAIDIQFPCSDSKLVAQLEAAIQEVRAAGHNPRMAVFDAIASMPGLRIPFERLTRTCKEHSVLSLIDGAHAIGQIPLDLSTLGTDFFTSNLHKWLFVPRGCALLHVPKRNQHLIRTSLPTSHGFKPLNADMPSILPTVATPFVELFEFVGTLDVAHYLTVPTALTFRSEICGGEERIQEYCFWVVREGGRRAAEILGTEEMDHPESNGRDCAFRNVRLPIDIGDGPGLLKPKDVKTAWEYITHQSAVKFKTYIQVLPYRGVFWMRLSGMIYLEVTDCEFVAQAAKEICEDIKRGDFMRNGHCARCVDEHPEILKADKARS